MFLWIWVKEMFLRQYVYNLQPKSGVFTERRDLAKPLSHYDTWICRRTLESGSVSRAVYVGYVMSEILRWNGYVSVALKYVKKIISSCMLPNKRLNKTVGKHLLRKLILHCISLYFCNKVFILLTVRSNA